MSITETHIGKSESDSIGLFLEIRKLRAAAKVSKGLSDWLQRYLLRKF